MQFSSHIFLLFFAVVLAVQRLPISWRAKKLTLLVAQIAGRGGRAFTTLLLDELVRLGLLPAAQSSQVELPSPR